jgi:hypothetical protein
MDITTFDENAKIQENKLMYKIVMLQKKETGKGYLVNIKRTEVLLNDTIDQDPFTEILFITAKIFYDLDLEISNTGTVLNVLNIKEIQKKWKEIRFKIDHTYTGDIVEPVMQSMDKIVENEDLFLKSFQKDPFFYYYFLIYGNCGKHELFRENIPLYGLWGNKPVRVDTQLSQIKERKEDMEIDVKLNLKKEEETALQLQQLKNRGEGRLTTDMSGNYTLLTNQRHIETIDFLLRINWDSRTIKKIQLVLKTMN